jgi:hypothetical protein
VVGISYTDYLQLTPQEADTVIQAYSDNKLEEYKLYEAIIYNTVGQAFAGGKFSSIFAEKQRQQRQQPITVQERKIMAEKLLTMFGEVR